MSDRFHVSRAPGKHLVMLTVSSLALVVSANAQEVEELDEDTIVVRGIRGSIQESLDAKRRASVVSDSLIGVEIGDLPDLSVAEALERITGVTSDRFKGGASEVSIRGLGAFLGYSTLNGRELTSGSDGRGVNFGQFPSELFQGATVYKSQQASFVEGGVSGTISLQTLRPLDYGKRRVQINGLVGYSDYADRVDGSDAFNQRVTVSYVDQFESDALGEIGLAIGGQIRRDTSPEDIYTTSSNWRPCTTVGGSNCSFDPSGAGDSAPYFVSNQYIFRALDTESDRDAVMADLQWRPTDKLDFNLDVQWSDRSDLEERHNLALADGRRGIVPLEIAASDGALLAWEGNTRLENQSVYRPRDEEYLGGGLEVSWDVTDRLLVSADFAYSKTERRQDELDMRIRTDNRVDFRMDTRGLLIPELTFLDDTIQLDDGTTVALDLNDVRLWENGARARRRLENVDDESTAFRLDAEYVADGGFFTSFEAGLRIADRQRIRDDGIDATVALVANYSSPEVQATLRDRFINDNLYEGADTPTEGISWTTWDPEALFVALTGDRNAGLPTGSTLSTQDTDVTELTTALYVQGNFASEMFGTPMSGNIGLRMVKTDVESLGITQDFTSAPDPSDPLITVLTPTGEPAVNVEEHDFVNWLPSANITFEVTQDQLLRFAAYRAIARPAMEDMSAALSVNDDDDGFPIAELANNVSAVGNPFLEPLSSWNADVSWEWYHSDDTAISIAAYYKLLETGIELETIPTAIDVNGAPVPVDVIRRNNSDEESYLFGAELSVQHVFSNLPGALSGLGVRGGINWADSDFEFPDPTIQDGNALADLTKPLNIPGYSKFSGNLTVFWENEKTSLRLAYRGRSGYNKPFRSDANRFTAAQEFLDFSASYELTDSLELRVQGLNLLDEPNVFQRPVKNSLAQADFSGRRYFVGARLKF